MNLDNNTNNHILEENRTNDENKKADNSVHLNESKKTIIEVTVVGADRTGVVADITNYIFKNGGNIEKINQNVIHGLFGMQLEASFILIDREHFDRGIKKLSDKLSMEIKVHYQEPNRLKNLAILVSKEDHCLKKILETHKNGELNADIRIIIGSTDVLKAIAEKNNIPFYHIDHFDQNQAEKEILDILEKYDIDIIVLARYMRILTPGLVWRYPAKIINIHPSLLPAFPGAYAYVQAYERGAKIIGCTAHFVTEDLDQGPIICQNSFKVSPDDKLETIKKKGQSLEAVTLVEALKLVVNDSIEVYWGRVHPKRKENK